MRIARFQTWRLPTKKKLTMFGIKHSAVFGEMLYFRVFFVGIADGRG
jgi:hypothetical protein